jgi:hypothetical protein
MRFYAFVLLAPLTCLAQVPGVATAPPAAQIPAGPKAPPEVDQALRARANAFLDYESKGENRKAYELVAEDSKDYYFGVSREKAASFTIDEVQYGPDLSTATVRSTIKRQMRVAGHPVEVPQVEFSLWKLEKGQWVWYHDPAKDTTKSIIGPLPVAPVETAGESPLPKDIGDKREREVAPTILTPRAAIDKKLVSFVLGKDGTEQVIFHNGNNGAVRVQAEVRGVRDTITVEPNNHLVDAQADLQFKIIYKPSPESALRGAVLFAVEPFGSVYVLPVRLAAEGKTPRPGAPAVPAPAAPAPAAPAAAAQ